MSMIPVVIPIKQGGGGGGGLVYEKDVNFYGVFGELLYSYTVAEAQALSALPDGPDYSGNEVPLTFQNWNYTLAQVSATTGPLDIGAVCATVSGKTEGIIRLTANTGLTVSFYVNKYNDDTLVLDYGDSNSDTSTTNGTNTFTHTYAAYGEYHYSLWDSTASNVYYIGNGSSGGSFVGGSSDAVRKSHLECYLGANAGVNHYGLAYSYSLRVVMFSHDTNYCGDDALYCDSALQFAIIPNVRTGISRECFRDCTALSLVCSSSAVRTISSGAFYNCYSIKRFIAYSALTSIGSDVFYGYYNINGCIDFYFYSSTPPTLSNTNAFRYINAAALHHVKSASLSAYQAATNWSTYSSYMVGDAG